jgi:hypothetical protein
MNQCSATLRKAVKLASTHLETIVESPAVSPYLQRRLRTLEEALQDIAASHDHWEPALSSRLWPASINLAGGAKSTFGLSTLLSADLPPFI